MHCQRQTLGTLGGQGNLASVRKSWLRRCFDCSCPSIMKIPEIRGLIDRRLLVNFRIDADVLAQVLPPPFEPQLVNGYGMGGICLIRLKQIRPAWMPLPWGLGSENAAHRFAVTWPASGSVSAGQGVYIPRRDTSSRLNSLVGGRVFPGVHHHARFDVAETDDQFRLEMRSNDEACDVTVVGRRSANWPADPIFPDVAAASHFFEQGSVGYSDTNDCHCFDGLELACENWRVEPLEVEQVHSSYFENLNLFPEGSVQFDHALLMQSIAHRWRSKPALQSTAR